MLEDLKSLVEQEQARKEEAFKATRELLRNEDSLEPIKWPVLGKLNHSNRKIWYSFIKLKKEYQNEEDKIYSQV